MKRGAMRTNASRPWQPRPSVGQWDAPGPWEQHPTMGGLERAMGFEPTTSCLGSRRSATELRPLDSSGPGHGRSGALAPFKGSPQSVSSNPNRRRRPPRHRSREIATATATTIARRP